MILEEIKAVVQTTDKKEFRKFGLTMGIFLILLGLVFYWYSLNYTNVILITGGVLLILGLLIPIVLRPIFVIWMSFATVLGFIMTRLILGILFYVIFFPVSVVLKILGKDFLDQKFNTNDSSYWKIRESRRYDPKKSENQF
ncbi:MAG: SxtJ family membrane protein [Acidobacteriota bacterium]|jgi:cytochrome b subunit of formate dehydrogenase